MGKESHLRYKEVEDAGRTKAGCCEPAIGMIFAREVKFHQALILKVDYVDV